MPNREKASEIEDAATVWAVKAERGLTGQDKAEFENWIDGDSRRLGAYVQAQAAWIHAERSAALGRMPEAQASEPEAYQIQQPQPEAQSRSLNRRMFLGGGGALAGSIAVAYAIGVDRYQTFESGIGEVRHLTLKSGAKLTLDTDTRVDVATSSNGRMLDLIRGNMFLNVPPSQEAVVVRTGGLFLETMQGAFSLQNLLQTQLTALVTNGSVIVAQSVRLFGQKHTVRINEGHVLTLSPNDPLTEEDVRQLPNSQQADMLAWRDGMLSFGGELLVDAVRSFDRYGPTRIVVADSSLARQKVIGLFKADDPSGFAMAVAASFGGIVTSQGNIIRISAK
jgi:transmembrane sensor